MNNCIFCEIINGNQKSYIVLNDDNFIAFLDKRPLFAGHSLLLPKAHIPTFYDLPAKLMDLFFLTAQRLGKAIEKAMQSEGSFLAMNNIVSQSVPHLHLHIIPRNQKDGLKGLFWPRQTNIDEKEMQRIVEAIKNELKA